MNHRERIRTIVSCEAADRRGSWIGDPHPDAWPILHARFRTFTQEELQQTLYDDFRWIWPQFFESRLRILTGQRCSPWG